MNSIKVDSWVVIDGDCPIGFEVEGREIQFRLGDIHGGGLDLVLSEEGLEKLAVKVTEALEQVRRNR